MASICRAENKETKARPRQTSAVINVACEDRTVVVVVVVARDLSFNP
jgi:hypothetical protein